MAINKNKQIALAEKFVQKAQYDRAVKEYMRIVEEDPRDVRVWLKIGDLFVKQNLKKEAVQTYKRVAEFYSDQGFYLKAVAVYKQILKLSPESVDINLKLAELYKQLGLLSDAMQQYELVSSFYQQAGRTRDAVTALCQIVELDPENVATRIKLAELYSKEDMRAEAIDEFSKAADYLRASNRTDDFIKVAERLIYHQPENASIARELAQLYVRRQDPRRALQKLQVAFKADPRDEETLELLAQAFADLGQSAKTISVLKELTSIYGQNGVKDKQRYAYERILALDPNDADAKEHLRGSSPRSSAHIPTDQTASVVEPEATRNTDVEMTAYEPGPPEPTASSVEDIAASTGADYDDETARILAEADVYIKYRLFDKAVEHLKQLCKRDPQNIDVRVQIKDLLVESGRPLDAARELYTLAQRIVPTNAEHAARYLEEAILLDGNNAAAKELLVELQRSYGVVPIGSPSQNREESILEPLDEADFVEELPLEAVEMDEGYAVGEPAFEIGDSTFGKEDEVVVGDEDESPQFVDLSDDLEEVDFFIQQSLLEEARAILVDLLGRHPGHPDVKSRIATIDAQLGTSVAPVPTDETSTDLAHILASDNGEAPLRWSLDTGDHLSVEEVFDAVQQHSQETSVGDEDADTHYDLGLAYREMGLYDDAIAEFSVAMAAPARTVSCHMMIGLCYVDKGMLSDAISQFKMGLYVEGISDREMVATYYELGQAYERLNDLRESVYYYEKVAKKDGEFRDVQAKLSSLRPYVSAEAASVREGTVKLGNL